jgi:type IV pilus assembly protein PilY1
MVYFGTGKYYDEGDNSSAATPRHSFYAIADIGSTVDKSTLLTKTMTTDISATPPERIVDGNAPNNPVWATQNGWQLHMDANGERVTTKPLLIQDKLIFPTLIPTGSPCDNGGRSWIMEVVAVGDKFVGASVLGDNLYNEFLILGDLGFGQKPGQGKGGIVGTGTDSTLLNIDASTDASADGRQSWRQLR